jgi:uncharacterized protein (TIGR01319 family)
MSDENKPSLDLEKVQLILATDCGSTTSKARLFRNQQDGFRFVASGEAPTTVEAPFEDVTEGVTNAVKQLEQITGLRLIEPNGAANPGVDLYVSTSSAGGGLQMMVAGVIKAMTAETAERAALGAGAIVMDEMAIDDGREVYERIQRMRHLRPDMILLAGGTDGGTIEKVLEVAEWIAHAEPKPRLGTGYSLPVVYAGNTSARKEIQKLFDTKFVTKFVDNIRPQLEVENTGPARDAIHEFFMEHVMSHAPGYDKLMRWTSVPIIPTPAGEGKMFQIIAERYNANVIGVGLGGATTNVYSIYDRKFVRTVSANLGMSYSICNVLKEAGIENITRWIPFAVDPSKIRDDLRNKMIRPTTIPETLRDLMIEHAVAREALRLGFIHHKYLARPLKGAKTVRDMSDIMGDMRGERIETYIDMLRIDWLAGTGGLLSHAPKRAQSALILVDAFQPEGITRIAQDSVFMMPHLGVLATVHPRAAMEVFEKDCLVRVGTCIAPRGHGKENENAMKIEVELPNGKSVNEELSFGTLKLIPLQESESAKVEIKPIHSCDVGAGPGHTVTATVEGGKLGIIIDCRGRPLALPQNDQERVQRLTNWFQAVDAYPKMEEIVRS